MIRVLPTRIMFCAGLGLIAVSFLATGSAHAQYNRRTANPGLENSSRTVDRPGRSTTTDRNNNTGTNNNARNTNDNTRNTNTNASTSNQNTTTNRTTRNGGSESTILKNTAGIATPKPPTTAGTTPGQPGTPAKPGTTPAPGAKPGATATAVGKGAKPGTQSGSGAGFGMAGSIKEVTKAMAESGRAMKVDFDPQEAAEQPGIILLNPRRNPSRTGEEMAPNSEGAPFVRSL